MQAALPSLQSPFVLVSFHPSSCCCSMDEVQAQLDQMSDRARERAVSIAEAVRAAGDGDADLMTRLQHQQDDQLQVGIGVFNMEGSGMQAGMVLGMCSTQLPGICHARASGCR